jgi:hypothetical protein
MHEAADRASDHAHRDPPPVQVEQDTGAAVPAGDAPDPLAPAPPPSAPPLQLRVPGRLLPSSNGDGDLEEWQMVTPGGSPRSSG